MNYYLKDNDLEVTINSLGAEMISVRYQGKERLWQNENNTWSGHAPILFPICGKVSYINNGINYEMKRHGFARLKEFTLYGKTEKSIKLMLKEDEETLGLFPYEFILIVEYSLSKNSIKMVESIINTSDKMMYTSLGGHTSFSLDNTINNYKLVLKNDSVIESLNVKNNLHDGTKTFVTDDGIIDLSTKILDNSETLIIESPKSHVVSLYTKENEKVVDVEFINYSHLLLWHPEGSKMVCIEPWNNLLDYENKTIEFKDKDSIIKIEGGREKEFVQIFTYY